MVKAKQSTPAANIHTRTHTHTELVFVSQPVLGRVFRHDLDVAEE